MYVLCSIIQLLLARGSTVRLGASPCFLTGYPTQAHNTRTYFEKHGSRQRRLGVQGFEIGAARLSRNDSRSLLEYVYPKHTLKPL